MEIRANERTERAKCVYYREVSPVVREDTDRGELSSQVQGKVRCVSILVTELRYVGVPACSQPCPHTAVGGDTTVLVNPLYRDGGG